MPSPISVWCPWSGPWQAFLWHCLDLPTPFVGISGSDFFFFWSLAGCSRGEKLKKKNTQPSDLSQNRKTRRPMLFQASLDLSSFLSGRPKKLPGSVTSAYMGSWKSVISVKHLWSLIRLRTEPVKLLLITFITRDVIGYEYLIRNKQITCFKQTDPQFIKEIHFYF